ncbi:hypothetical protein COY07_04480 [Candidatus Peregrinibacteria bacterium CG_4_10_14_0_2_um_filter_43_11]|nr:MAG: hypothetical protein COY07_04480 [Candidatus Peregrinibacteria bacterium CG_4_10_14_0_2_um_filter_43_11]
MKKLFKKISALAIGTGLILGLTVTAFAQSDLFSDPLDTIKDHLSEDNIDVIDFSNTNASPFGNLPIEIIEILKDNGYENLTQLKEELLTETDGDGNETELPPQEQIQLLEGLGLTNAQANFVYNEVKFRGESQVNTIALTVIKVMRNLIGAIAIIFMVVSGIRMIMARGDETAITEQKKYITYSIIGLVIILLAERIITTIYGTPGTATMISDPGSTVGFSAEVYGLVGYIKSIVGIIAVLMIIVSGVRLIAAYGEEEKIKQQYKSITWIAVGVIIIIVNQVIVENLFILPNASTMADPNAEQQITTGNIAAIVGTITNVMRFALGFLGIIAMVMLIYGGMLLIISYTNEELAQKAKKIITNSLIGIVIILIAYAIVTTVIGFS